MSLIIVDTLVVHDLFDPRHSFDGLVVLGVEIVGLLVELVGFKPLFSVLLNLGDIEDAVDVLLVVLQGFHVLLHSVLHLDLLLVLFIFLRDHGVVHVSRS